MAKIIIHNFKMNNS